MLDEIKQLKEIAIQEISKADNLLLLENLERKFIGRNGKLRDLIFKLKDLKEDQKKEYGQLLNETKKEIERIIQEKKRSMVYGLESRVEKFFDVTLPGEKFFYGHLHPSTQLKDKVVEIFSSLGFEILEGPEVDNEYYNFETLNIPAEHPARDMWDTFYLKSQTNAERTQNYADSQRQSALSPRESALLLRTHTSNMQVRVMEKRKPPLRICVIGKCFRHEATNATHEHTLYQIEGFVVDEKITLANLIYTLKTFLTALYNHEVKIRVRPAYFPFVEPGLEVDMSCVYCEGKGFVRRSLGEGGCSVCKGSGWIELLGAGMIHPKVFEYARLDSPLLVKARRAGYLPAGRQVQKGKYTGFAFGVGLDRLVMMKYKIDDIRRLHSGDLRFIKQF